MGKLLELLRVHVDDGCVLVFVDTQEACDAMFRDLLKAGLPAQTLHGGMSQDDRDSTISDFKSGATPVLVATSVAARGLDVKDLACVINYEVPNHYEDYVHRVGRTGRAGNAGVAHTLITPDEEKYAPDLVKAMEAAGQTPPDDVVVMANTYRAKREAGELLTKDYRTSGFKSGKGIALDAEGIAKNEKEKREKRRREKRAAGVELGESDEEEEAEGGEVKVVGAATSGEAAATMSVAAAAAQAARALQVNLGNATGAGAAAAEVQKMIRESAKKAQEAAKEAARQKAHGGGPSSEAPPAAAAPNPIAAAAAAGAAALGLSVGGGAAGPSSEAPPAAAPTAAEIEAAAIAANPALANLPEATRRAILSAQAKANEIAARASASLKAAAAAQQAGLAAQMPAAGKAPAAKPTRYAAEIEINDYPQTARFKVTHRDATMAISEWTKAAITTKGAYYPLGRNPPPGERKLYLVVEGETEAAVKAAKKEIKRILDEASVDAAPDASSRYSKYSI